MHVGATPSGPEPSGKNSNIAGGESKWLVAPTFPRTRWMYSESYDSGYTILNLCYGAAVQGKSDRRVPWPAGDCKSTLPEALARPGLQKTPSGSFFLRRPIFIIRGAGSFR